MGILTARQHLSTPDATLLADNCGKPRSAPSGDYPTRRDRRHHPAHRRPRPHSVRPGPGHDLHRETPTPSTPRNRTI